LPPLTSKEQAFMQTIQMRTNFAKCEDKRSVEQLLRANAELMEKFQELNSEQAIINNQ